mgnify:CR=1 FL=1
MDKELITIKLETYEKIVRKNEQKNIQINDLLADNHNLRIELEDLEATIEELNRKIESLEIEEVEELEGI